MKILIDEKIFTKEELNNWKKKRIKKVLHNLKSNLDIDDNIDENLLALKLKNSYDDMIKLLQKNFL